VGCGGIHSTTRELSGIQFTGHDIEEPWAVFDATLVGWPDSYEVIYAYLDGIPVNLTALPGGKAVDNHTTFRKFGMRVATLVERIEKR